MNTTIWKIIVKNEKNIECKHWTSMIYVGYALNYL